MFPQQSKYIAVTVAAMLCEKEQSLLRLDMDEIYDTYFSDIFYGIQDWKKTLTVILPYEDAPLEDRARRCWDRMSKFAAEFLDAGMPDCVRAPCIRR